MSNIKDTIERLGKIVYDIQEAVRVGIKETSFAELILKSETLDKNQIAYDWDYGLSLRLDDDLFLPVENVSTTYRFDDISGESTTNIAEKAYRAISKRLDENFMKYTVTRIVDNNGLCTSRKSEDMLRGDFVDLYNLLDCVGVKPHTILIHNRIFNKVLKMYAKETNMPAEYNASVTGRNIVATIKDIPQLVDGSVYVFGAPEKLGRYFVSNPRVAFCITTHSIDIDIEVLTARKWGDADAVGKSYVLRK